MLGFGVFGRIRVRIGPEGDEALRMGQGGTNRRTDGWTDRFPLCSTGLCPLWCHCPSPPLLKSHNNSSRARVPLTIYCLWAAILICYSTPCHGSGYICNIFYCKQFSHYCPWLTIRDCPAMYQACFFSKSLWMPQQIVVHCCAWHNKTFTNKGGSRHRKKVVNVNWEKARVREWERTRPTPISRVRDIHNYLMTIMSWNVKKMT